MDDSLAPSTPNEPAPTAAPDEIAPGDASGWSPGDHPSTERPSLRAGSVLGRTLDTFLAGWEVLVAVALPAAVLLGVGNYLLATNPPVGVVLAILSGVLTLITTAAMTIAADELHRGVAPETLSVLRRALPRTIPLLLMYAVLLLAGVAVLLLVGIVIAIALVVFLPVAIVAVPGIVFLVALYLRWSLAVPAIVLEGAGAIDGLGRSYAVTKGNVLALVALFLGLGLVMLPLSLGSGALAAFTDPIVGAIVVTVSTIVSMPIAAALAVIAYADLARRPGSDVLTARSRPRRVPLIAALVVAGLVLLVPAIFLGGSAIAQNVADRGRLLAGTGSSPVNRCRPTGIKTEFSTSEDIYLAATLARAVPPDEEIAISFYIDGDLVLEDSLPTTELTACYYESEPVRGAAPATYRMVLAHDGETLADGEFTVR